MSVSYTGWPEKYISGSRADSFPWKRRSFGFLGIKCDRPHITQSCLLSKSDDMEFAQACLFSFSAITNKDVSSANSLTSF